MKTPKKIPDGQSNFETIRTENYAYVDKTRFIEQIENEDNPNCFLIRPRKFGKSLFTSVLEYYYDLRFEDRFQELFGDLYIGKNPTPKRNKMFVLNIDFSGIDTNSIDDFNISLLEKIKMAVTFFITDHRDYIGNIDEAKAKVWSMEKVSTCIEYVFDIVKTNNKKAYIIVDEYDHFANDMIASGSYFGEENYKKTVWAGSQIRDFYETLKANGKTVIDKMFITGITPIMLDDVTSGFNISNNLSNDVRYNEMLGFTEKEVEFLIDECGIDRKKITIDREFLYNGYMFHGKAKNKLYNSAMITYLLYKLKVTNGEIEELINENLKIDYGRIENLLNKSKSIEKLENIIEFGKISSKVVSRFSIDKIYDSENFLSLLYYMGMLTIDNSTPLVALKIPNYSTKTMYWEFIKRILIQKHEGLSLDDSEYLSSIYELAYKNNYIPFFDYFSNYIVNYLSNRDLLKTIEKDIKFLLLPIFFTSNYYLPISELENSGGYTDIYLKRSHLHPKSVSEWIFEIKYIKQCDSNNEKLIEENKKTAIEQLQRYKTSNLFKDRNDVRYLAVVFVGKKKYSIQEI